MPQSTSSLVAVCDSLLPDLLCPWHWQVNTRTRLLDDIEEKINSGSLTVKRKQTVNFMSKMALELGALREQLTRRQADFADAVRLYRDQERLSVRQTAIPMQTKSEECAHPPILSTTYPLL